MFERFIWTVYKSSCLKWNPCHNRTHAIIGSQCILHQTRTVQSPNSILHLFCFLASCTGRMCHNCLETKNNQKQKRKIRAQKKVKGDDTEQSEGWPLSRGILPQALAHKQLGPKKRDNIDYFHAKKPASGANQRLIRVSWLPRKALHNWVELSIWWFPTSVWSEHLLESLGMQFSLCRSSFLLKS